MKKREWLKCIIFGGIVAFVFVCLNRIFILKNTSSYTHSANLIFANSPSVLNERMDGFYQKKDGEIDMLFLGTSVVHAGIDNNYLYSLTGISSYDLSADQQKMSVTYYYLKEALKYQKPSVVFVEVQGGYYIDNTNLAEESAHYSFDNMRLGANRLTAISDMSIGNKEEIYTPFSLYHSRWEELTQTDFSYIWKDKNNRLNGHIIMFGSSGAVQNEGVDLTQHYSLEDIGRGETKLYLDRIIQLCEENGIICVLVKTPISYGIYGDTNAYMEYLDAISQYAQTKNILFWNFNDYTDEMELDYETDFYDGGGHLNWKGSRKFTAFLSDMIINNLQYTDRRGTDGYEMWDNGLEYENRLIYGYDIYDSDSVYKLAQEWSNSTGYIIYIIGDGSELKDLEETAQYLINIEDTNVEDLDRQVYFGTLTEDSLQGSLLQYNSSQEGEIDDVSYRVEVKEQGDYYIWIDGNYIDLPNSAMEPCIIVYDKVLGMVIDCAYIKNDGGIIHED